jgi:L-threonylcarbamoyladenylate synthase
MSDVIKTKIFNKNNIEKAAELIAKGEIVAFPTETVYGLGANALDAEAIEKIFIAKKRPQDNPLIVHVTSIDDVDKLGYVTNDAIKLTNAFWPGPLTIILKKKNIIPKEVTANLETAAFRMPNHEIALKLIKLSNKPIAAPSANISGRPSSTNFKHVYEDLNGRIAGIIKYDESDIGIESSVVDLTTKPPQLLRPGGVSLEQLREIIPEIKLYEGKTTNKSPGMKYKHYAPKAKIVLFEISAENKINEFKDEIEKKGLKFKVLKLENTKNCTHELFNKFRELDREKTNFILIKAIPEEGIGLAIMNRVRRAATIIKK